MRSLILLCFFFAAGSARAEILLSAMPATVIECPAYADHESPPDFGSEGCQTVPVWRIDPQGRQIWLKAVISAQSALLDSEKPLGVFVSAKASSEVYLNGRRLGANGSPAASRAAETPGRMDAVFYAPRESLRVGDNDIVIRMSSHHGLLRLRAPVHFIGLGEYADPTTQILDGYWPSLITFGAFMAGAIYFAAASVSGARRNVFLLSLISLFAAAQLFAEAFRGVSAYPYPAHDWRLLLILVFSIGFGLCLLGHVCAAFLRRRRLLVYAASAVLVVASSILAPGFDGKAAFGILSATIVSVVVSGVAAARGAPQARLYCIALLAFAAGVASFPSHFLDVLFFYEVAALLLVFFVLEAVAFSRERALRENEAARARQLELALENANRHTDDSHIRVVSAGRIELIRTEDIVYCKGAGDYVEIVLSNGKSLLHNGNLADLEEELPAGFLRAHRSYLVNTDFVRSLLREASGTGRLLLTTDMEVPVSRRIMPKVRSALA